MVNSVVNSVVNPAINPAINLEQAVEAVQLQQVIAYPTEAVFGLGCNPLSLSAVQQVLAIKGREADKGLILIASQQNQLTPYIAPVLPQWQTQFDQYWPGHVTFIVPVSNELDTDIASVLTGGRETIAVRVSNHPVVAALCRQCSSALVSTSANRSGQQPLRTAAAVRHEFADQLAAVIDADCGDQLKPSRIIDIRDGKNIR